MWYKQATETIQPPKPDQDYSTNPDDLNNGPVALNITPDVAQRVDKFAQYGKPTFFRGQDGKNYLMIHGTPDGYFNTGEPSVNSNDGNPTNDGFVSRDGLGSWLLSKGWGGNVNVIACYAGKMERINFGGGSAKSYFGNKGEIGYSTMQTPDGQNRLVFQNG